MISIPLKEIGVRNAVLLVVAMAVLIQVARFVGRLVPRVAGVLVKHYYDKFGKDFLATSPLLTMDVCSISIASIEATPHLLGIVNQLCHYTCVFLVFRIGSIRISFFPYILVEIDDVVVRISSHKPGEWSAESILASMKASRSRLYDKLGETLDRRRRRTSPMSLRILKPILSVLNGVVDYIISCGRLSARNVVLSYRSNRSVRVHDVSIVVKLPELTVVPSPWTSVKSMLSPHFGMNFAVKDLTMYCVADVEEDVCISNPLLEPASISGSLYLPKILSYLLVEEPLDVKYISIKIDADKLMINADLENLVALSDFSIGIATYRLWYTYIEMLFEKPFATPNENLFSYITAYSAYLSESDAKRKKELSFIYEAQESKLCNDDVRLCRALVMGWHASDVASPSPSASSSAASPMRRAESDSRMQDYKLTLRRLYDEEQANLAPIRKVKVDISVNEARIHLPCFRGCSTRRNQGSKLSASLRRSTLVIQDIHMYVTDPIVKEFAPVDEPRRIGGQVARLVLINTGYNPNNSNIPILDRVDLLPNLDSTPAKSTASSNQPRPAMASFDVIESITDGSIKVKVELNDAILVPEAENVMNIAEYAVLGIEDINRIYSYYVDECQIPTRLKESTLPASLMNGDTLDVECTVRNVGIMFAEPSRSNSFHVPAVCGFLDASVTVLSRPTREMLKVSVPSMQVMTTEYYDNNNSELVGETDFTLETLIPSFRLKRVLGTSSVSHGVLEIFYELDLWPDDIKSIVCPRLPATTNVATPFAMASRGTELLSKRIMKRLTFQHEDDRTPESSRIRRGSRVWQTSSSQSSSILFSESMDNSDNFISRGGDKVPTLHRVIKVHVDPIELTTSADECGIFSRWMIRAIRVMFPTPQVKSKRDMMGNRFTVINRMRSIRRHMVHARKKRDQGELLDKIFSTADITGDRYLTAQELKSILNRLVLPLNLLRSEVDEILSDLIMLLDRDFDGKLSKSEFRWAIMESPESFSPKGRLSLLAREFEGADFIGLGNFKDGKFEPSPTVWNVLESEMGISYSSRSLGSLSPLAAQTMLIRLCGNWKLAKSIWEQVIRPNIIRNGEEHVQSYVWAIEKNKSIGSLLDMSQFASRLLQSKQAESPFRPLLPLMTRKETIFSCTQISIGVYSIKFNISDVFLGPGTPRIQFELYDNFIDGRMYWEGIMPHTLMTSKDCIGITGGCKMRSSFFNSLVQHSEPIIDPWSSNLVLRKNAENGLEVSITGDHMNINISSALLQTLASVITSSVGDNAGVDFYEDDNADNKQNIYGYRARAAEEAVDRSVVELTVHNAAGCHLGFRVTKGATPSGTESVVRPNEACVLSVPVDVCAPTTSSAGDAARMPVGNDKSNASFPCIIVKSYLTSGANVDYHQLEPMPLHILTLNSISICPRVEGKYTNEGKFSPALILQVEEDASGNKHSMLLEGTNQKRLIARSNFKVRNFSGASVQVMFSLDATSYTVELKDSEVHHIPIEYAAYIKRINMSIKLTVNDSKWSMSSNLIDLLRRGSNCNIEKDRFFLSTSRYHIFNSYSANRKNIALYDNTIDIISGVHMVNALPYPIEVKLKLNTMDGSPVLIKDSSERTQAMVVYPGKRQMVPIMYDRPSKLKFRIVDPLKKLYSVSHSTGFDEANSSAGWSDSVDVRSLIGKCDDIAATVTRDIPNQVNLQKVKCHITVTLDSVESNMGEDDSPVAPTLVIYSDIWVQNNSTVSLKYKFAKSSTDWPVVISDASRLSLYENTASKPPSGSGRAGALQQLQTMRSRRGNDFLGPVIASVGTTSVCVKLWNHGIQRDFSPALQNYKKVSYLNPNRSSRKSWSAAVTLVSNHVGELVTGDVWLGVAVSQGQGVFHRTKIITITPRYLIQNKTSLSLNIFSTFMSKMTTMKGRVKEMDGIWSQAENERRESVEATNIVPLRNTNFVEMDFAQSMASIDVDDVNAYPDADRDSVVDYIDEGMSDSSSESDEAGYADSRDVKRAEAILKKRRASFHGLLGRRRGFTRGLSPDDDTVVSNSAERIGDDERQGEVNPSPDIRSKLAFANAANKSPNAFSTLKSKDSCVIYSFGEQQSLSALVNQALTVSLTDTTRQDSNKNYVLLKLISASQLAAVNSTGSSDPYCRIYWQGERLFRTREVFNTINPVWNESFMIALPRDDISTLDLRIEVMDYNVSRADVFLGQVTLRAADLLYSKGQEVKYDLQPRLTKSAAGIVQGSIILSTLLVNRRDAYKWTPPIRVDVPGVEYITVKRQSGLSTLLNVAIETQGPMSIVTFKEHTEKMLPAYKIENRTPDLRIRFRQQNTDQDDFPRRTLRPSEYCYYGWDNLNLPKVLEIAAVDGDDLESPIVQYRLEGIGDRLPQLNISNLASRAKMLDVRMQLQGHIRIITISAEQRKSNDRKADSSDANSGLIASFLKIASFDFYFKGVAIAAIDDSPKELFNLTIEGIRCISHAHQSKWSAFILHCQLDNMMHGAKYPVIFCPLDSGLNSERNDFYYQLGAQMIPFIYVIFDPDWNAPVISETVVIHQLEFSMRPLNVIFDLNFFLRLIQAMITRRILIAGQEMKDLVLSIMGSNHRFDLTSTLTNAVPSCKEENLFAMVFLRTLHIHPMSFQVLLSLQLDKMEVDEHRDIAAFSGHSTMLKYFADLSRTVSTTSPKFNFFGLSMRHAFDRFDAIAWRIAFIYISQAVMQAYKIFGSMDVIGDPIGVIKDLGSSLKQFVLQTGFELTGQSPFRADGIRHLVQGVIGSPFGGLAKVSGNVGTSLAGITSIDVDMGSASAPAHLGEGVVQAGVIFAESIHHGVVNAVKRPAAGIREKNAMQTISGAASGLIGLVLSPAVGAFGAVTKLTQSIDSTTHAFDKQMQGRRRPIRPLFHNPQLLPLSDSTLLESFMLRIESATLAPELFQILNDIDPTCSKLVFFISVQYGSHRFFTQPLELNQPIVWETGSADFPFAVKWNKDSWIDKKIQIKFKASANPSSYLRDNLTLGRRELHPLDLTRAFNKVGGSNNDATSAIAVSTVATPSFDQGVSKTGSPFILRRPKPTPVHPPTEARLKSTVLRSITKSLTKTGQSRHSGFPNVECRTTEDAAGTDTNRPVIMGGGYFNPMLHDLLPAHGAPETRAPVYINRGESPGSEAFEGASLASSSNLWSPQSVPESVANSVEYRLMQSSLNAGADDEAYTGLEIPPEPRLQTSLSLLWKHCNGNRSRGTAGDLWFAGDSDGEKSTFLQSGHVCVLACTGTYVSASADKISRKLSTKNMNTNSAASGSKSPSLNGTQAADGSGPALQTLGQGSRDDGSPSKERPSDY